jgi:hypothetical protein
MGLFKKMGERRTERMKIRKEARAERVAIRNETKQIAYQSGFDPNASITGMVSSLGQSTANIFGSKFGKDASVAQSQAIGEGIAKSNTNPIMLIVVGVVLLIMMFKK